MRAVRKIRLMPDYFCWPLWWHEDKQVGNLDPAELGVSQALQRELQAWADTYDSWLNLDDPGSGWKVSAAEVESFEQRGFKLWIKLRKELGDGFDVVYFSQLQQRVIEELVE